MIECVWPLALKLFYHFTSFHTKLYLMELINMSCAQILGNNLIAAKCFHPLSSRQQIRYVYTTMRSHFALPSAVGAVAEVVPVKEIQTFKGLTNKSFQGHVHFGSCTFMKQLLGAIAVLSRELVLTEYSSSRI